MLATIFGIKAKQLSLGILFCLLTITSARADVGLMVALPASWEYLHGAINISTCRDIAGRKFCQGHWDGRPIVIVRSPMGKVNNAITSQLLLSNYDIDTLISFSPAGAIAPQLTPADLVVAREVYQHDFGTQKPYGFLWNKVPDGSPANSKGYNRPSPKLASRLLAIARSQGGTAPQTVMGTVVSGDQFISSLAKKEWLAKKFQATAVDMGAAAIAQVAFANKTPVCILRVITDQADAQARTSFAASIARQQNSPKPFALLKQFIVGL